VGTKIQVGDKVKLIGLPGWLLHDLPASEQQELRECVGKTTVVTEIDAYGYYWLGFGTTVEGEHGAFYNGHSFGVPREFIELET
jgi:hypothetical protein